MGFAKYDVQKVKAEDLKVIGAERTKYFEGIGKNVQAATSVEAAIALSGLGFEVKKYPVAYINEVPTTIGTTIKYYHEIPKQYATVRTDTMESLGIVGKNYEILQNLEAFDFLDSMVGEAKFETAGSYGHEGAKSFITMSTEPMKVLGDEFKPYILFTNSFDGSGSVRVMFTPIRVFCSNCLARAIREATNKVSIKHSSNLKTKLEQAREILLDNTNYLNAIKAEAEKMAITPYTEAEFKALVHNMFATEDDKKDTVIDARNEAMIKSLINAYNQDDLQNYNNTVYKAVQAFADWESHKPAFRNTSTIAYKNIGNVMIGMPITNMIANQLMGVAA